MHVQRNMEARSKNHCCREKVIGTTYSQCVSVALDIQHVRHMRPTVICEFPVSTIFFHIIS